MKNQKRATLKDVAKEANVNFTLVSKFVTRNPSARMSKETAERIKAAIKKLNYRPSSSARTLRNGRSKTIGLFSGDLTNAYRAHVANLALLELGKMGYQMLLTLNENPTGGDELLQSLISRDVDGVFYLGPGNPNFENPPCPLIVNDRHVEGISEVNVDFAPAIDESLEGVSGRIVSLCFDNSVWKDAVEKTGKKRKLETQSHLLPFDIKERLLCLHSICDSRPEAILVNGWHTVEMLQELLDSEYYGYNPKIIMHANCRGPFFKSDKIYGAVYSSGSDMVKKTCESLVSIIEKKSTEPLKVILPSKFLPAKSEEYSSLIARHYHLT
jgi:probable catabolite control protein A